MRIVHLVLYVRVVGYSLRSFVMGGGAWFDFFPYNFAILHIEMDSNIERIAFHTILPD